MENRKTCRNAQCFCDGSCQDLIKSDINYTSVIPMENKTAEEKADDFRWEHGVSDVKASAYMQKSFYSVGEVNRLLALYTSQQLAEKDKEIERYRVRISDFADWLNENFETTINCAWLGKKGIYRGGVYASSQLRSIYFESLNK